MKRSLCPDSEPITAQDPKKRKYEFEFIEEGNSFIEGEIWTKVSDKIMPNNESKVSNLGRIQTAHEIITTGSVRKCGYHIIGIRGRSFNVHHVVITSFGVEKPSPKHNIVTHIDGDKSNNRLDNLAWKNPIRNVIQLLQ